MEEKQSLMNSSIDLFSVNYDHPGTQQLFENVEKILYHDNSIMRIWFNNVTINYPTHWHTALEIVIPVENYYDMCCNNIDYHIEVGEILIVPPGILHDCKAPATGTRFVFLFDISLMTRLAGFARIQHLLAQAIYITPSTFSKIYSDIMSIMLKIRDAYFMQEDFYEMTIYSLLLQLFTTLGYNHVNSQDLFTNIKPHIQKNYVQKFNSLLDFIDTHYMENLSLEDAAFRMGFSKYHFSRLFRQYTSFTFCDYINFRRLCVAEALLSQPELTITEVAMQSGFPSISTFNRIFKQNKGCSPSDFRSKNSPMKA